MTSAVVFAYHDVGVRCLAVLLAHGVEVRHVYTHADDPNENIWFGSVAEQARLHGIHVTVVSNAQQKPWPRCSRIFCFRFTTASC